MILNSKYKLLIFLFFLFFLPLINIYSSTADDSLENYNSIFDWKKGVVSLHFSYKISNIRKNRAQAFYFAENTSKIKVMHHLLKSVLSIRIDSRNSLENIALSSNYMSELKNKIENSMIIKSKASKDLNAIELYYELPIYPEVASFLIDNFQSISYKKNLVWTPSEDYTGLIIYAKDPLDVHGEFTKKLLNPAIFIKLYDEDINPIIEKEQMFPSFLRSWGSVAYTDKIDDKEFKNRVGKKPIKTIARGIFGTNYTDAIISNEVASKIWSNPNNINMLREGRILIIISSKKIKENLTDVINSRN